VLRKPNILSFSTKLNFPAYIGRANEELSNVGDLVVPQGTNIGWVFNAQTPTTSCNCASAMKPNAESQTFRRRTVPVQPPRPER
jgi:hypothetical protein